MTVDEFAKTLILGLPNFVGLVYGLYVLKQQNDRLIALLEKVVSDCIEEEELKS